jgi:RAS guanyl-releasing protein 3
MSIANMCYFQQFHDLKKYADSGSLRDTPRLERSVIMFNGLTQWIQCMVLSRTMPQQRADVIAKFIDVAMVCMCQ